MSGLSPPRPITRAELAALVRREAQRPAENSVQPLAVSVNAADALQQAEAHAAIAARPSAPPRRLLARLVSRCVHFLARGLTRRQQAFNLAMLDILRERGSSLRTLEESHRAQMHATQQRLRELEKLVGQLQAALAVPQRCLPASAPPPSPRPCQPCAS